MSDLKFVDTHNLIAFLEKPTESEGFEEIVDFLNANLIKFALTVNPTIYCSCVKQFWDTVKAKMVNGEVQLQALVDKKKVIITESTIRRYLQLEDANGVDCLPNAAIFEQLTLMGYEKLSQKLTFYKAFFSPQWKFLIHTILQCLSAKTTAWNEFSSTMASAIICLATNQKFNFSKYIFDNMVKNVDSMIFGNMKREGKGFSGRVTPLFQTMMVQAHEEMGEGSEIPTDPHHTPIITQPSSSQPQRKQKSRKSKKKNTEVPQPSGSTDNAKSAQDSEIASLKKKVKKLERRNKSRTLGLKRLRKVGSARRVESSDEASLGDQEDASKQGRKIADIDADAEVTLIDETQGRNDDNLMFDTGVLDEQEVEVEKVVSTAEVTTESATTTTVDELTLAQTLIEIKAAKPKVRGVMIQEPSEFTTTTTTTTPAASKPSQDKGKAKMIESEKPLKKKDQIMYDQEVALNLQAQLQAELEEEERLTRQKEVEANIALIESWDNTQAMMDVDYQMAQQLQAEEQEQLSIEEKSKLFVQLLEARKKHFAEMKAREKRNKPPTQAQQRKLYCNYLKNMEGYTLKQLKGFKFEVIKDMFDKAFKRVNTFVDYKTELVEGSEKRAGDSTKRAGTKLEQEVAKKQKIDDVKVDDDQVEARMKELMNIVPDEEEVAIDAIPLPISLHALNFDREDLETLWKLVKAKHMSTRLKEGYERVLWGDLMILFELDVEIPGRIVGIKSFIRLFGITAALIKVSAAQEERSYALSWKPCQGDSLNLPDHRYKRRCCSLIPAESDSLPHAHAQTTKTYYKHQDSRIKKAQELKTKTSANSDIQDLPLRYQVYQGRLLASFQDDAKYEHVGQDTRSQGGKDDKDKQGKDLKISESKTKSKDNDKG
ncbi:hypothetical protein Tco_0737349 [Tanacetum coccineum]